MTYSQLVKIVTNLALILRTIENQPDGMSLSQLLTHHPTVGRRTAQRYVKQLLEEKKIISMGRGPSQRYLTAPIKEKFELGIPLSEDSKDIVHYIQQAPASRIPIGYQRSLLDNYQPNKTHYLPASLRHQLYNMGNVANRPYPAGTYAKNILNRLLIDLSWASSHLEGNTYSLLDTKALIEHGKIADGKGILETQMILNHKAAIEFIIENLSSITFNRFTLLNLHSTLSRNLLPNAFDEGRLRQSIVGIGQSVYRPLSIPAQIEECFDEILRKANLIQDPFEQSFFIMVHLPYLQPFIDVNKRTSRLAANIPLIKANLCPLSFLGVSEEAYSKATLGVYELTRIELLRDLYAWAYQRSTQEYLTLKPDVVRPDPLRLAYRQVVDDTIHLVIMQPEKEALTIIDDELKRHDSVSIKDREDVRALIIEELQHIHEGVLVRYRLRPSDLHRWKHK